MRLVLLVGAVMTEAIVALMLLGGVVSGITDTYALGAAGYSRLSWLGAALAVATLWAPAWFGATLALGLLLGLPRRWREDGTGRLRKVCTTGGMLFAAFCLVWFVSGIVDGLTDLIADGRCRATLRDVLRWAWPCR